MLGLLCAALLSLAAMPAQAAPRVPLHEREVLERLPLRPRDPAAAELRELRAALAAAPADFGLPRDALLVSLVGFNLGVEAGQLAVVGLFLPGAFLARRRWAYRRLAFAGGSAAIALVAAAWMMERIFDVKLL